jgi:hypothetical protein
LSNDPGGDTLARGDPCPTSASVTERCRED